MVPQVRVSGPAADAGELFMIALFLFFLFQLPCRSVCGLPPSFQLCFRADTAFRLTAAAQKSSRLNFSAAA